METLYKQRKNPIFPSTESLNGFLTSDENIDENPGRSKKNRRNW